MKDSLFDNYCSIPRCAEVVVKLQLCTDQLSQLSDIRPHLEVRTTKYFISCINYHFTIYYSLWLLLGRHGSASLCRVERENKMAATYNVLAFKR